MKIIHVLESSATGTLEAVRVLANEFSRMGYEIIVVYSERPDTPENISSFFLKEVRLIKLSMGGRRLISSVCSLRKIFQAMAPDIVHLHSSVAGFVGRLASFMLSDAPKVFYSPHCISFMRRDIGVVKRNLFIILEKIASIKSCIYLACSKSELSVIKLYLNKSACIKIDNCVDLDSVEFKPKETYKNKKQTIVTVGGIRRQKDPILFGRIAEYVLKRKKCRFIWIGDGDPAMRIKLERYGVEVTGWKDSKSVLKYLTDADLYLSTSEWEGMPIALLEAMATATASIVRASPGNIDLIHDKVNGETFIQLEDACEKIIKVLENDCLRISYGEESRRIILNSHVKNKFIYNMLSAYSEWDNMISPKRSFF